MIRMFTRLAPLDARSIGRDGLMRILPALPLLVVVPVRFVLPVLLLRLGDVFGTPLDAYYPGIASAATAVVIGHVAGGTKTIRVGSGGVIADSTPDANKTLFFAGYGRAIYGGVTLGLF